MTLNEATSASIMETPFTYELGQDADDLFNLADVVEVVTDPSLNCGQVSFKFDPESQYLNACMVVSPEG